MLYFFLSYARGGDDFYVQEFFNDLCDEVRVLEGLGRDADVGFFDNRNIQPGDTWPETLVDALSRCQSFLALCSPAYFLSEPCGREWAIFQERARQHQLRTGSPGSGLLPLRWLPSRTMPPAAQVIQYVSEPRRSNGPEPYRERGIRQLLRIQRNRDDYLEFVATVAELVVEAAQTTPLPAEPLSVQFEEVASAFHPVAKINHVPADVVNGSLRHPIAPADLIPRSAKVYFVVSAPTADQAADEALGRHDRQFYGEAAWDWTPYKPATNEPLADYATRIAAERSLTAEVTEVDELEVCIAMAERDNQMVVLLVDPWSTKIEHIHEILLRFDQGGGYPAAVMIPWNAEDLETRQQAAELNAAVRRTFPVHSRRQHTTTFRPSVLTNASFGSDLQAVLAESRNRVIASATVRRPLPAPIHGPILEGP